MRSVPAIVFKTGLAAVLTIVVMRIVAAIAEGSEGDYAMYMIAWILSFPVAVIYVVVSLVKNLKAFKKDPDQYAGQPFSKRMSREACSWGWAGVPLCAVVIMFLAGAGSATGVSGGEGVAIPVIGGAILAGLAVSVIIEDLTSPVSKSSSGLMWLATRPRAFWKFLTVPRPARK